MYEKKNFASTLNFMSCMYKIKKKMFLDAN